MRNTTKSLAAGAVMGGALLFTVGLGMAGAQPPTADDGRVNLTLGSAGTLEDVEVTSAVQIAAAVCNGVEVPQVTTSADDVDATGTEAVVCTNTLGAVTISQNGPGNSENAPGQQRDAETPTSSPTTTPEEAPAEPGS
jgi:hypothetical protein